MGFNIYDISMDVIANTYMWITYIQGWICRLGSKRLFDRARKMSGSNYRTKSISWKIHRSLQKRTRRGIKIQKQKKYNQKDKKEKK